jgi:hypothetical protein
MKVGVDKLLVVHVSLTPLAGSPIRIINALNAYTKWEARLVNLSSDFYGNRRFPEDLLWSQDADEVKELIARADVVHFHHWFEFGSSANAFGFDFLDAMKSGAASLMHWHSSPEYIARTANYKTSELLQTRIPQLVMAQYHESLYPDALPVPWLVETEDAVPTEMNNRVPVAFFSPTNSNSAFAERWETKGKPEVLAVLRALEEQNVLRIVLAEDLPFDECRRLRKSSDIVIDDVVTGSFHTTSLEALSEGKAVVAFLDSRSQAVLAELTGTTELPFVNAQLEQLEVVLRELCSARGLLRDLGRYGSSWMRQHYSERAMIQHYVNGYESLLEGEELSNPRYTDHAGAKIWLFRDLPDLVWKSRRKRVYPGIVRHSLRLMKGRLRNALANWLPAPSRPEDTSGKE